MELPDDSSNQIIITVHCASDLLPAGGTSDNCDPYCIVTIGDQKQRTKQQKKGWPAKLSFSVQGVDPNQDYIKVEVKDANHRGFDMGRLEISFLEICTSPAGERWYRLHTEYQEDLPSCISLLFEIRGQICPLCSLFIGDEESVPISSSDILHVRCLVCVDCGKPKPIGELFLKDGRLYDIACFERRFGSAESRVTASISGKIDPIGVMHVWVSANFLQPVMCNSCGLVIKDSGLKCQECNYTCHAECKLRIPNMCLPSDIDSPKSPLSKGIAPLGGATPIAVQGLGASGGPNSPPTPAMVSLGVSSAANLGAGGPPKRIGLTTKKKK